MESVELEKAKKSVVTLANAAELSAQIVLNVAGNDISNRLSGSAVTLNMLRDLTQARFQNNLKLNG